MMDRLESQSVSRVYPMIRGVVRLFQVPRVASTLAHQHRQWPTRRLWLAGTVALVVFVGATTTGCGGSAIQSHHASHVHNARSSTHARTQTPHLLSHAEFLARVDRLCARVYSIEVRDFTPEFATLKTARQRSEAFHRFALRYEMYGTELEAIPGSSTDRASIEPIIDAGRDLTQSAGKLATSLVTTPESRLVQVLSGFETSVMTDEQRMRLTDTRIGLHHC
jgi:hypothetical protein